MRDTFSYWLRQAAGVAFVLYFLIATLGNLYAGDTWGMLHTLACAMVWAAVATRTWEKRHKN